MFGQTSEPGLSYFTLVLSVVRFSTSQFTATLSPSIIMMLRILSWQVRLARLAEIVQIIRGGH